MRPLSTRWGWALLALLMSPTLAGCTAPQDAGGPTLRDDAGRAVQVGDLSRIVVTSVDLAEVFVLLGQGDRLVGVPEWIASSSGCVSIQAGAERLPRIGRPVVIEAEEVLSRDPTMVIDKPFPLSPSALAERLDGVGVPVFRLDATESLDNVRHTLETVGRILSSVDSTAPENATALWSRFEAELQEVGDALDAAGVGAAVPRLRALYQLPAGLVAAGGSSASLLLGAAGATDIAAAAGLKGYRQVSAEVIAAEDPERLVVSCTAGTASVLGAPRFSGSTAARLGAESVFIADPSTSALVGPRFPTGVRAVAEWLYPSAFGLITPDVVSDVTDRTLQLDAANSTATRGPLRFRLDPGDGSPMVDSPDGRFGHQYADQKAYQATLYLIDADGRIEIVRLADRS